MSGEPGGSAAGCPAGAAAVGAAAVGAAAGAGVLAGAGAVVCCAEAEAAAKHSVPASNGPVKMRLLIHFLPMWKHGLGQLPSSLFLTIAREASALAC
jgi:hypothetical protein